ncbi:MAG TPA: hypothetical protein VFU27_00815, partial [Terriglobales bacterium]|nr:hypothetical protein [Terriglobales bacterium]
MPVARIISSSVEDALKFADYLRPLFDTVEIAQPGRASNTLVDLEVNLELCTPEQAWEQIAQAGEGGEAEVFVAPGTLFAEPGQLQESDPAEVPAAMDEAQPEVDTVVTPAGGLAASAAGSNGSGAHTPDSAAVAPEHELSWLGRLRVSLRQRLAVRALLREIREMEEQRRVAEQQRQRQMALQFERERRDKELPQFATAPLIEQPADGVPKSEQQQTPQFVSAMTEEQVLRRQAEQEMLRRQAEEEEAIRRGIFVEQILKRRA